MKAKADILIGKVYRPYVDKVQLLDMIMYPGYYMFLVALLLPIFMYGDISFKAYMILCLIILWLLIMIDILIIKPIKFKKTVHHTELLFEGIDYTVLSFNSNGTVYSMVLSDLFNEYTREFMYIVDEDRTTITCVKAKIYIDGKSKYKSIIISVKGKKLFNDAMAENLLKNVEKNDSIIREVF